MNVTSVVFTRDSGSRRTAGKAERWRFGCYARTVTLVAAILASAAAPASSSDEMISRGRYLATAADCTACHTVPGGKSFAGGVPFRTAFGTIYSPNITPDARTGIGRWTDAQFLRAMQEGIGPRGQNYYPAFPYVEFSRISSSDVIDIRAYLASLPAILQANHINNLPFPYGIRPTMKIWNFFNFTHQKASTTAAQSQQYSRGQYLVEGLAHCGECHTPRNFMQGLVSGRSLGGATVDGWNAYNITPDPISGIGGWTKGEIVRYLATGHVEGKAHAAGPMADAITYSLSHLLPKDLEAIAVYLRAQTPIRDSGNTQSRFGWGSPDPDRSSFRPAASGTPGGRALYVANCAACHALDGGGVPFRGGTTSYPSMMHDTAVGAGSADNLVLAILNGVRRQGADGDVLMPGFGAGSFTTNALSDEQVAAIANYLRSQFGDPAVKVDTGRVAMLRSEVARPVLLNRLVTAALFAGGALALAAIGFGLRFLRKRDRRRKEWMTDSPLRSEAAEKPFSADSSM